jgi:hypothetical protein
VLFLDELPEFRICFVGVRLDRTCRSLHVRQALMKTLPATV